MLHRDGVPVGINGIGGRIGGNTVRAMIEHPTLGFNVIAGNDVGLDPKNPGLNFAQVKRHDSTFGPWPCAMAGDGDKIEFTLPDGSTHTVSLFSERDPGKIRWGDIGVTGVAECTGIFLSAKGEKPGFDSHFDGGAQRVALSAPAKQSGIHTVVFGVHKQPLNTIKVISGASCTSGSLVYPLRVILDHKQKWGFRSGKMTTVHAYTAGEQVLQDAPKPVTPGARRMSAAALNIIPTTTGAAKTIPKVDGIGEDMAGIPFDGFALRVPVASGSITLLEVDLEEQPSLEEVIASMMDAATHRFQGKFAVNSDPNKNPEGELLVSSHVIKRPESSILDVEFCTALGAQYGFPLWYGNEWGYVNRFVEALHEQCA